jgi:sec-independent protein translocase protein TatA
MGGISIWHILLVALIVLVLFGGRGKLSDIMGDFAKGIKSFKKGLSDEDQPPPRIDNDKTNSTQTQNKDTATHQ